MKIKMIKAYQGVSFEGVTHTFFTDLAYHTENAFSRMPKARLIEHDKGVLVLSDKAAVLVGWANIGSIEYDRSTVTLPEPKVLKAK
jgi:hypothetical protein